MPILGGLLVHAPAAAAIGQVHPLCGCHGHTDHVGVAEVPPGFDQPVVGIAEVSVWVVADAVENDHGPRAVMCGTEVGLPIDPEIELPLARDERHRVRHPPAKVIAFPAALN
eukprot:CAMPEP_0115457624 /NCGR_PEP_ID=MMETSP0271-20121206/45313_1 /TAXON_ID=71861 /ORGANISM="Scrippsiella trochoidea, Strain CCMP3099" /LENGTH=111 /DNA_ID=CAMNT_0002884203 /DNA_START=867 /DNA_END=1202 /DNA_ORIENTATION=-